MTRAQALSRWRKFAELERSTPACRHVSLEGAWQRFAATFAAATDQRELVAFGADTDDLAWLERDGASPWDFARAVSAVLRHEGGQVPAVLLEQPYWRAVRAVLVRLAGRRWWHRWLS